MAGFYPDAPGRRMAWDADGTVALVSNASAVNPGVFDPVAPAVATTWNNESDSSGMGASNGRWVAWIFPELRELDGTFFATEGGSGRNAFAHTSTDTTNGVDGSWDTLFSDISGIEEDVYPDMYRTNIRSAAVNAIRAVRLWMGTGGGSATWRAAHLYGEISPGETPDRLLFIDEDTGLEFLLPKDFGDVPRGSAREWQFRLKNNSTAAGNNLTINTIQFTAESLFLNSAAWYTFSVGGDAFAATKQISSLAPEAESALIVGRQIIPVNEVVGPHTARIRAVHTSLS